MKLLVETFFDELSPVITEKYAGKEPEYFIEGIFMEIDKKNRNGRVYPRHIVEREVRRYNDEYIKTNRAIGELNHPKDYTDVNPERASHLITELRIEGDKVIGKAKILNTPVGQVVKALLKDGVQLGVSSRGFGTFIGDGRSNIVQDDFRLKTIDIVSDPSVASALVKSITESREFFYDTDGTIKEVLSDKEKKILENLELFLKTISEE